jgi:choline monooxygenase
LTRPHAAACITAEVIARLNRPTGSATGLPRDVYIDADFYELERDRVLAATWVCVGVASDLPNPGDLLPYDFGGLPLLLLLRDERGDIRAFHNVCSHRGVHLVAEPRNTRGSITCPYHAWTYERLDGHLTTNACSSTPSRRESRHRPGSGAGSDSDSKACARDL